MAINHVFVYGTLLQGMDNFHLLEPYAAGITPGFAAGELHHLRYGYPALIIGQQPLTVEGEIVAIKDMAEALAVLDHLEGYHGPGDPRNLYDRVEGEARSANGEVVPVYVYVWTRPEKLPAIGQPVSGGCWRRYMARRRDDVLDRYYFAYGSCMDYAGRIAGGGYAAEFQPVGAACLDGWRFRLNKLASDGRHVCANIERAPGQAVYGILYHISGRAEQDYLNRREGYPQHYYKEYLDVTVGDAVHESVIVYIAKPDYLAEGLPVAASYESELRRGGAALPAAYRAELLQEIAVCAERRQS